MTHKYMNKQLINNIIKRLHNFLFEIRNVLRARNKYVRFFFGLISLKADEENVHERRLIFICLLLNFVSYFRSFLRALLRAFTWAKICAPITARTPCKCELWKMQVEESALKST